MYDIYDKAFLGDRDFTYFSYTDYWCCIYEPYMVRVELFVTLRSACSILSSIASSSDQFGRIIVK